MNLKSYNQVVSKTGLDDIPKGNTLEVLERLAELETTQYELEEILQEVVTNHNFFKKNLWNSAYSLGNIIIFALDAKFIDPKKWGGTELRNKVTGKYKYLLSN